MKWGRKNDFELRKSVRLPVSLPVKVRLFDIATREPSPTTINGQTRNIASEGLCLETNTTLIDNCDIFLSCIQGHKLLQLEIKLPNISHPLCLRGKVIWYDRQTSSAALFCAGIYITEATERCRSLWQKYVGAHKARYLKALSEIFSKSK